MGCKSAAKSKLEEETTVSSSSSLSSLLRCKHAIEASVEQKAIHEQCGVSDPDDDGEEEKGNAVTRLIPSKRSFPSSSGTSESAGNRVTR